MLRQRHVIHPQPYVDSSIHHDQIRSVRAHLQQFDHVGGHAALLAGALKHLATLIDGRPHEWASWHRARAYQEHDIGGIAGVRVRYELHHVVVERDPAVPAPCRMRHFATDRPQLGNLGEPRRREVHVLVQRRPTASEHIRPPRLFDGIGLAPRIIGVPDNERRPR